MWPNVGEQGAHAQGEAGCVIDDNEQCGEVDKMSFHLHESKQVRTTNLGSSDNIILCI